VIGKGFYLFFYNVDQAFANVFPPLKLEGMYSFAEFIFKVKSEVSFIKPPLMLDAFTAYGFGAHLSSAHRAGQGVFHHCKGIETVFADGIAGFAAPPAIDRINDF
jgi:hypothetical protein